jgi:hypothetical protein
MSVNRTVVGSAALALALVYGAADVQAQGCVASRIDAPVNCPSHDSLAARDTDGMTYHLKPGRWQASFGYRWFRSHRHFVGSVEQNAANVANGTAESDRSRSEVINHMHLPAISVGYGLSNRVSLGVDVPMLIARRKSPANNTRPIVRTEARGIGDLVFAARYWVGDPKGFAPQNVQLGIGIKAPTGNDRLEDDFLVRLDPTTGSPITQRQPVDQSIQPGDGGWGLMAELTAFKAFGRVTAFAAGNYLANPREQNDFLRSPFATNQDPTSMYLSISDQYSARLGLGTGFGKVGVSLAARMEGVPSSDLIGGDMGRRRPGYSVSIEPGVSYSFGKTAINLSVPYLVRRVRTQNISDKLASIESGHKEIGDAAFADYVVMVGFSRRF